MLADHGAFNGTAAPVKYPAGFFGVFTGSYDIVWYLAIALGVAAGLINLPVREGAIARPTPQAA